LRLFVSRTVEEQAREHAGEADAGHQHHMTRAELSWRERLTSMRAWSDVAENFRGDWQMLWKEIATGFLLAGFIAQFSNGFSASSARSETSLSPPSCGPVGSHLAACSRSCSPT
jgi:hypothetical protein